MRRVLEISAALGALTFAGAARAAANSVEFSYADVEINFDAGSSIFSMYDHTGTSLRSTLVSPADVPIDAANIPLADFFDFNLEATVVNPAGLDNISMVGLIRGTGTDLGATAYFADIAGAALGADLDGVTFSNGILSLNWRLEGPLGGSILADPAAGDWIFTGTDDTPIGPGADGTPNQITVPAAERAFYSSGKAAFFDLVVSTFSDGSSTAGINNADDLFAQALLHGGFNSRAGDMKITIVPEPAGLTLLAIGALTLRRRPA